MLTYVSEGKDAIAANGKSISDSESFIVVSGSSRVEEYIDSISWGTKKLYGGKASLVSGQFHAINNFNSTSNPVEYRVSKSLYQRILP